MRPSRFESEEVKVEGHVAGPEAEVAAVEEVGSAADDIAAKLIGILVGGFKMKQNRDPTESELDELLAELTEERINAMLGFSAEPTEEGVEAEEEERDEGEEEEEEAVADGEEAARGEAAWEEALQKDSVDKENSIGNKRKVDNDDSNSAYAADAAETQAAKKNLAFSWPTTSFAATSVRAVVDSTAGAAATDAGAGNEGTDSDDEGEEEAAGTGSGTAPAPTTSFAFAWPTATSSL